MLTNDERLAVLEAMQKRIKPELDNLKGDAKNELLELCGELGIDRRAILVNGEKVGEVGIAYTTPKPAIIPGREKEAVQWLYENGMAELTPRKGWEKCFVRVGDSVAYEETGEICGFLEWMPSVAKTAAVRGCKPEDVLEAMQGKMADITLAGLLEG